ncbi:MAG: UDP-N-acetylmuramoyl-L-alanyl-D-glutamate--2,6-diaminopimelate ligase [Calditrichia bacterium]
MLLSSLLNQLSKKSVQQFQDVSITGIQYDPLRIKPGNLFIAVNIYTQLDKVELPDGHEFVEMAIANGAAAIMVDKDVPLPHGITVVRVPDSRKALSLLAAHQAGYPDRKLKLLGVTGTNGKTTTTHILESIFSVRHNFSLTGTLYYKINGEIRHSKDTTPEPTDLQIMLQQMVDAGTDYCAMEVSSHGIDFHRVYGLEYEVGIFTNLSPDHLDYHLTMENYRDTKLRFFETLQASNQWGIVNADDPLADMFADAAGANVLRFGLNSGADVVAENIDMSINATRFDVQTPSGRLQITSKLIGEYNVYNMLGAIATAITQGVPLDDIKAGCERSIVVPGRFEFIDEGQNYGVVVDFAHTPDSMENVLKLARKLTKGRLITVFGCGGDRDPIKRPQMGRAAEHYSDIVVATADNPRFESLERIFGHMQQGLLGTTPYHEVADRGEAIHFAISQAKKDDLVLLLGKGHETTQIINDESIPFNDEEQARAALKMNVNRQS